MNLSRRALLTAIAVLAAVMALAFLTLGDRSPSPSRPPQSPAAEATPLPSPSEGAPGSVSGPTVWYSVLGNGRLTLYERRLDGRSTPIELAWRPSDEEGESSFIVGPAGSPILAAQRASRRWSIEPVSRDDPEGEPAWSVNSQSVDFQNGVWSLEGRYWAGFGNEDRAAFALVIDATTGEAWRLPLRRGQYIQGFDGVGPDLVVRNDDDARSGQPGGVRFEKIDPATGEGRAVDAAALDVPPHSSFAIDVAPRAGLFVTENARQDGRLIIGELRTGAQTVIHQAERTFRWVGFFPAADRVAGVHYLAEDKCGETQQSLVVGGIAGGVRELWRGTASPLDMVFAPEGDMIGFHAWGPTGSSMTVVDSFTGRWVDLPTPEGSYDGELLAIRGGDSLPEQAVAPEPSEAAPATTPLPDLVKGAPSIVTGSVEHDMATCEATIHVRIMRPTIDGALAVVDELPPVVFADVDRFEASVDVLPRPGSPTVLVSQGDGRTRSVFLWTPDPERPPGADPVIEPLPLPEDWPYYPTWLIWYPDGEALGKGGSARRGRDFLWFELGDPLTRRVRATDSWGEVVGWTSDGSSIVVRRDSCIDACDAEFKWLSVIRLSDGQTRDVTPDSPIDAIGTGTEAVSVRTGLAAYLYSARIDFSEGINVPGDFSRPWPARAGAFDPEWMRGVWSRDGRSLYVVADASDGRVLLRIDNPRPGAPLRPKVVGRLPGGAVVEEVEIAGSWAHIQIRGLGSCREGLANLETGEAYLGSGCVMSEAWLPQH